MHARIRKNRSEVRKAPAIKNGAIGQLGGRPTSTDRRRCGGAAPIRSAGAGTGTATRSDGPEGPTELDAVALDASRADPNAYPNGTDVASRAS